MTVINGIEIDHIEYKQNEIKKAIINNKPIEEKLHVVVAISNAGLFARRYILMKEFVKRMEMEEPNVIIYVVELIYENQKFIVTSPSNKRHLQLYTKTPLWHKENMINVAVKRLLPSDWKAFAWIDADIEFENVSWAMDTLKILNGSKDIVQLFSHALDLNMDELPMNIFSSFAFHHTKNKRYCNRGLNYWHPGYAWAMTRLAYERVGGLYEKAILGSGDNIMSLSLINQGLFAVNGASTEDYKNSIRTYQKKMKMLRLGYIPGVIRHHYHGNKKNRFYGERWKILINCDYSPTEHITHDTNGLLVPTENCPIELIDQIKEYFDMRNEDEGYTEK